MTMQEMIEKFDYTKMSKSPAVFDYGKLKWLNGEYIKEMDDDPLYGDGTSTYQKGSYKRLRL